MIDARARLIAIAASLLLLFFIVELVRRRRMKEEYSVLWVLTALVVLLLAAWIDLLEWVTDLIGGVALSSTIFFFALLFVFFMLLHFSLRVSALERTLTALVQEIGLQGARRRPLAGGAPASGEPAAPRVAALIPCFNDGELVEGAVASVREDEPVEVVVVDDGSTDAATAAALERLEARGVEVVRQPNAGVAAARSAGLKRIRARYVFALDADDELLPGALGAMADVLDGAPDAAFTWGDYEQFGTADGVYRSPERMLPWTLTYVNPYPIGSLYRRSALAELGGWESRPYEDWDLFLRAVGAGMTGVRTDRRVYRRRLHGDQRVLRQARLRHREAFDEIRRRNAPLFARREELRLRERPAYWKRLAYPIVFGERKYIPLRVERVLQQAMMRSGRGLP